MGHRDSTDYAILIMKIIFSLVLFAYPLFILIEVNAKMMIWAVTDKYYAQWPGLQILIICGVIAIYFAEILGVMIVSVLINKIYDFLGFP